MTRYEPSADERTWSAAPSRYEREYAEERMRDIPLALQEADEERFEQATARYFGKAPAEFGIGDTVRFVSTYAFNPIVGIVKSVEGVNLTAAAFGRLFAVKKTACQLVRSANVDQRHAEASLQDYLNKLESDAAQAMQAPDAPPPHPLRAVEFEPETHTYTVNGERLPSVTEIIKAALPSPYRVDDWYLHRGTATHLACELLDQGRLDWGSVDSEILPRVKAYHQWSKGLEIVAVEERLASREHGYAGTLDRMIRKWNGDLILADIKNSHYSQCSIQLAAYSLAWQENYGEQVNAALVVELLESGKVKEHWLSSKELREAERLWLSVLEVYRFMEKHHLLRKS